METVTVKAPPSKSLSHRMLIAAAMADGESVVSNVLNSDDLIRTRDILTALGAAFVPGQDGSFTVTGTGGRVCGPATGQPLDVYVKESGTTCRLIMALLAAGQGLFRIHGKGRMHERPVGDLAAVLESLGAKITYEGRPGCPPLVINASGLDPAKLPQAAHGMAAIGSDESSQYLSGLLLAAPLGPNGLTVLLGGSKVVSWPYVSLTLDVLESFGIPLVVETLHGGAWQPAAWRDLGPAEPGKLRFKVSGAPYRAGRHAVEGDWSGASYLLAAGAVGPGAVRVQGVNPSSLQGDAAIQDLLERMGARLEKGPDFVTASPARLRGIEADMGACPDLVPTLAAVAAHAEGPTVITGAAHLKIKESDRIAAPAAELRKVGCEVTVTDDGMIIIPPKGGLTPPPAGTVFSAHDDHRMAMSVALLGLPGTGGGAGFEVCLDNPGCVSKSFPEFWERWKQVRRQG